MIGGFGFILVEDSVVLEMALIPVLVKSKVRDPRAWK